MTAVDVVFTLLTAACIAASGYMWGHGNGSKWMRRQYDEVVRHQAITDAFLAGHLYRHGGIEAVDAALQEARAEIAKREGRYEQIDDLERSYRKPSAKRFGGGG